MDTEEVTVVRCQQDRGVRAWLVRWQWAGDHSAGADPIIAVLSPRLGADQVKLFVERSYAAASYSAAEELRFMRRPAENPYPARFGSLTVEFDGGPAQSTWTGEIYCGHNPWIYARPVSNLRADEEGRLSWETPPRRRPRLPGTHG
jgi:hypothetical protein